MAPAAAQIRQAVLVAALLVLGTGFLAYFAPTIKLIRERPVAGLYENRDFGFSLEIPPGYLAITDDNGALIESVPTWWDAVRHRGPVTVMAARVRPAGKGGGYPTGAVVKTKSGRDYVIYPWKGSKWPLFKQVAGSFAFTKR